ncbi:glycine betaine ABC transporter substrate-binding protein [Pandoraea oxalativorans]|uniref:Glycine/betaine ABC transporter substrate-binding protein n=1 Tax=Pandoraea oxalativorans TaxID=573737 RepID=A0A0E3U557_9BURK|nr:glycine betaine ABC transporter substrate-binding protein [Pandoraea oxalativorans]AKC68338.1 glycine/betaine ABC transporter substrate-binding protein [Pandoraea oxalativorans]
MQVSFSRTLAARALRLLSVVAVTLGVMATTATAQAATLTIGGKNFTEQLILSEMTAQYLRSKGYDVELKNGLGSVVMRQGMESNQLDVVWEYTGTSLIVYNKVTEKLDPQQTYERVRELDGKIGLVWLNPAALNNTYAFAMPGKMAREEGIETVSQLIEKFRANPDMQFAFDMEFVGRSDGLEPMEQLYDFHLARRNIKQMDPGLVYTALKNEQIDAGLVYTSDGRNKGFDLKVLADDKGFFPAYAATPVVRKEVLDANPKLADELNVLSAKINDENMRDMNAKVDIDHRAVSRVASDFLKQEGLVQ